MKNTKIRKILSTFVAMVMLASASGCTSLPTESGSDTRGMPSSSESIIESETVESSSNTEEDESTSAEETESSEPTEESTTKENSTTTTATTTTTTTEVTIPSNSTFSVRYIDVGQADAALIECDGKYMLIDGGNKEDSSKMYSVLKNEGATYLDIVVGTHAHEDHIGGIPGALNYATAGVVLSPVTSYDSDAFGDFKKYAESKGNGLKVPSVGDTYTLGSATVEILGVNGASDANNTSIVLMIEYGETKFLFTGDAEREAEQAILNRGTDLSATVLKVGHHGSDTSTSYQWLYEVMPEYAVISVGKGNSYGHPTDAVLSRLRDADVTTYRTDLNGDIYVTSDGKTVTVTSDKQASREEILTPGGYEEPQVTTTVTTQPPKQDTQSGGTDYILNTNTKKFHYPSCSSVDSMKESNKGYYTGSRDDLIAQGYSPCGRCHP